MQGFHADVEVTKGTFDPEDAYGPFPPGVRKRPESSLARAERKRGISVPAIQCPSLFVSSGEFGDERGRALASYYGGSLLEFPRLNHWGLVFNAEVRQAIASCVGARGDSASEDGHDVAP
jgi:hypothetical protein